MNELNDTDTFDHEQDIDVETGEILTDTPKLDDQGDDVLEEPEPPSLLYPRLDLYVKDFLVSCAVSSFMIMVC